MIKVKDGYAKLIGTTYLGSSTNVLLSNGGNFPIHSSRNNEANKLVRTDSNGFLQTGWINTTSGDMGTGTITKIYCSNDDYVRYKTPANFFSSLTNSGNNISITVAGLNRTLQVGYASNSDRVDNRHAISTTPNTGILYKSALYTPASLSSYWIKLASISSIGLNAEFVATIHVLSGHANLGRSAILLVYLRGDKSSFMSKSFKICCNSNYDPSRFRLYYRDSDKTSEIWYLTIGRWDGIITTVISQSDEGALYEGLTLYNGHINVVLTPSMSSYITALVSTITDNISGNATTASQLLTSRTLWGLSFNGTANVSGNIINTLSIKSISNRYLDLYGSSGVAFYTDNSVKAVVSSSGNFGIGTISPSYKLHVNGNAYISSTLTMSGDILLNLPSSTGTRQIRMACGDNDYARIAAGATDSNAGWLEIATADDANEPIYVRLYSGVFTTIKRTLTLLDGSGNTITPGYVTSTGFKKSGSSDSYVLLGGGGHKTIDSFLTDYDGRYVKKSGDMMTGTLTTYTNGSNNYNQGIRINRTASTNWATLTIGYVGTSTGGTSDNTWLIGTPANSNSLIFTRNGASETSGLCLKGGGNTDIRWNGNTVWHAGNDGSGSGLDADLLDGTHKSGLFTALSSSSSTNLSITIGGTTKTIADLYATLAVNADKLDNLQATSFMRCDGTNSIGLSGGNGNTAGWRLALEKNCSNQGWSINNIVFSVTSRHTGQGIMSIGFHTANEDSTTYSYLINFKGSTNSNTSSPWRAFYNTSTKKFRLFWYYTDYNSAQINVLSRSGFSVPTNGTWYEALPSDNGTELTIYYNNALTATLLLNSRKINGTSFNGTSDITTSYWGSIRTLTIGNTGKSVNGSGNVSWSLSEIGAASSSHTHGTLHSTFTTTLDSTTTDSGWSMINSSYNGFLLKSIRTQSSAPNWIENNYAAGICFGGSDTKGVLSIAYSSPAIRFAGGNGTKPVWWVRLIGASGATYNLANMWTGTRYWANIAVSTSSSTSTSPTFSSCYTSNWFRSEGKTGWYSLTYGGGWYMTDSTWLRSFNNKGVVAKCFYASDWSSSTYLLRSDGGAAAFHWSGQSGQPSWVWGGNNLHQYYVYNPSNFSVNYAKSAGNADTLDGLHSTHYFRKYNRSDMGSSMNLNTLKTFGIFEVRTSEITTTNSPMSGYYPLLNFINGEHVLIQIAGTTGKLFYRATQTANIGTSAAFTHSWAAFIDNTNYTSYIKKIGTLTVGGTDRPIYLSSGTPTPISSTKGSASLPVYLNAGTITACTPSSVFSNLSNSGTKLSISVAGQNRTLTVMYATSTLYVVSSGRQTALSGTTAANSGIRLYEAYNNGYPISYGNLLSMKGLGSTELLMGWKSGANRMYYRSNSDINEGWTGWSTVATLADISNAVKTGTTGHLAYYSSTSSVSSYNSNVGNSYTPIYLSSGVPKACNGVIITLFADYDIYCSSSNASFIKSLGNFSPVQSVTRISTGLVRILFSVNPNLFKIILVPMSTSDNGFKQRYVTDYAGYDNGSGKVNTIVVGISDDYSRNDGSFHMYIFNFNFL